MEYGVHEYTTNAPTYLSRYLSTNPYHQCQGLCNNTVPGCACLQSVVCGSVHQARSGSFHFPPGKAQLQLHPCPLFVQALGI